MTTNEYLQSLQIYLCILNTVPFSIVLKHVPFLDTLLEEHCGHVGFMKLMISFSFSSISMTGVLFRIKTGEESINVKSSSEVETLLNWVYGAFLSRM
jgi:hypothetical protein